MSTDIATITVTRGEPEKLTQLLPTLSWASELHVVETGPEAEATRTVAGRARVHHVPLAEGAAFDDARAAALQYVEAGWVLIVDTDELIPAKLVAVLQQNAEEWRRTDVRGVWIPRLNHVLGQRLRHSSAWPDYQLRFLDRDTAQFESTLHSYVSVAGRTVRLPAEESLAILHYNFTSTSQFVSKLNVYAAIEAEQRTAAEVNSLRPALVSGAREFAARYVKMRGYRDGWAGLHYCVLMGMYRYLIGAELWERNQQVRRPDGPGAS